MNNGYRRVKVIVNILCVVLFAAILPVKAAAQETGSNEFSPEQKMEKAKEYYSAGQQFIQQGDYSAADREFKKAQLLFSEIQPQADVTQAKAAEISSAAVPQNISPARSPALLAQETNLKDEAKPQDAILQYLKAIELKPTNADLYYNLAIEYIRTKQFENAAQALKRVIQLNPKDNDAYYNLGVIYESYLDDKKEAINFYARYLNLTGQAQDSGIVKTWIRQLKKEMKNK